MGRTVRGANRPGSKRPYTGYAADISKCLPLRGIRTHDLSTSRALINEPLTTRLEGNAGEEPIKIQ